MWLTRRDVLRSARLALGAAGAAALFGACGTSTSGPAPVEDTASRTPKPGGRLRVALTGGGAAEALDPFAGQAPADIVRNDVIYDPLFSLENGQAVPRLALAAEPTADGRSFVLRLREGVTWHDGSPFTAHDVAYSLRYLGAPERPVPSELTQYLDLASVEVRDPATLLVRTLQPLGDPALVLAAFLVKIVKDGTTSFTAVTANGTGPYRVATFEPGREARLTRFNGYWDAPGVADELVLLSLTDPQAKANAVLTGQADYAADIPFTTARIGAADPDLEVRTAGQRNRVGFGFVLNTTIAPFNDPRVRRAVRLAVDRQALVDGVFLGFGAVGNDLFGYGAAQHSGREPLRRDPDEARRLVREAGAGGTPIVIRSAEYEIGFNASTQLLAEQLKEVGLDVRPDIVGVPEFYDPRAVSAANGMAFSLGAFPLPVLYARLAANPALALADPQLNAALAAGLAETDEAARDRAWATVQDVMADRGNTVVWGLADTLSLERKAVAGVQTRGFAKYPYLGRAGLA
ncbi:ABC transporter substrate-binding protein [Saccharopolyspora phatthalungensis]|uniref:Peptide/nickel transport system substrate-binding protein n=1 Tax=Saccharopolyspora phatthalungensis TaxID=664693 RepID=A0A840QJ23_9PSEU|nr:ABC transporter substrate-binding protein [Saccharopolyspora phatthalungensis]MBB5158988.1 peptide/nickel transport system substrate-binding protein [Saccharopolyspora phatthalungensis]